MGREIRKVPADWQHPKNERGECQPCRDKEYNQACQEWYAAAARYNAKPTHKGIRWYHDYNGNPPDQECWRTRTWTDAEATHYQMYETVSEGTPVSPVFATLAELADYLVAKGDFWDQICGNGGWSRVAADAFVGSGFAPSLMVRKTSTTTETREPRDGPF